MAVRKKKAKVIEKMTTSMRLPIDLKDRLDNAAKSSGRSLTQEIEFRLESSFTEESAFGGPRMRMLALNVISSFFMRGAAGRADDAWLGDVEAYTNGMIGAFDALMRNHPEPKSDYLRHAFPNLSGIYDIKQKLQEDQKS